MTLTPPIEAPPNPRRRVVRWAFALMLVFLAVMFVPAFVEMDMMNGGYALIVLAGFAAFACLVTVLVFRPLARDLDRLFAGTDLIAEWRFEAEAWRQFTETDYEEERRAKLGLWRLVAIITVVILAGFIAVLRDTAAVQVAVAMLGLLIFLRLLAGGMPKLHRRAHQRGGGRVLIGRNGVWQGGVHHGWNVAGARLEQVALVDDEAAGRPWLIVSYSYPTRMGREETSVRLPVPPGGGAEARRVADALLAANPSAVRG